MKFTVDKKELSEAVNFVYSVIERKGTLPVLSNVLLVAKDNALTLSGTNVEVEKRTKINAVIAEEGAITVPANRFLGFTKNAGSASTVKFVLDGVNAKVSSGKNRFKLSTLPASEYPDFMSIQGGQSLSVDIESLVDGIKRCSVAMGERDSRFYLNGLCFDISPTELTLAATNGHRMMNYSMSSDADFERQVIVPRAAVLDILKMIGKTKNVSIEISDNNIKVATGNSVMHTKLIDGRYPDYKRVIPKNNNIEVSANTEEFKDAVKCVMAVFDSADNKMINVSVENGEMLVSAKNIKQEESRASIPVGCKSDIEIGLSGEYTMDAISSIESDNIELLFKDAGSPVRIDDGPLTATIMPIKI